MGKPKIEMAAGNTDPGPIRITCRGADSLPLDAIEEFQGNLKKRVKEDIDKIIKSIREYGFSFPFFVWKNNQRFGCIDGHGRLRALRELEKQGYDLPLLPVVYIEAANEAEAKQKLLRLNSRYGEITQQGYEDFTIDLDVDVGAIEIPELYLDTVPDGNFGDVSLKAQKESNIVKVECRSVMDAAELRSRLLKEGYRAL